MSSRNKRSAESEEVTHKKKPRKDDDDPFDEDDSASEVHDDDLQGLDVENIISTGRRTRGIRVDYTKVPDMKGIDDESGSETEAKGPKEREEAIANPRTRSPERTPVTNVEEKGEEEEEGGEDGQDEDSSDEDGDEDDDDEEA